MEFVKDVLKVLAMICAPLIYLAMCAVVMIIGGAIGNWLDKHIGVRRGAK